LRSLCWFIAALCAGLLLAMSAEELVLHARDDELQISAPRLHFLTGPSLDRLKNGASVNYDFQLSLSLGSRTNLFDRAVERIGVSYDVWEEKYKVTRLSGSSTLRGAVSRAYLEKVQGRMKELIGGHADQDRILQEAALLAERSDIQEELVRMKNHIQHFLSHLDAGGEVGKKLDFLLQEMNREANTLLSKTTGVAGEALRITELGLAMKSEIEQAKEQVQNLE